MKSIKCSNCGLVNFTTKQVCQRCSISLIGDTSSKRFEFGRETQETNHLINRNDSDEFSSNILKKKAWQKIKWGLITSIVGFAITSGVIYLGVFQGYENTERTYLNLAKIFSLITFLPLSFVLAGIIELITGIPISDIIKKWEELPQWLGWLIGIGAFFLVIFVIMFVVAVVIFNFF